MAVHFSAANPIKFPSTDGAILCAACQFLDFFPSDFDYKTALAVSVDRVARPVTKAIYIIVGVGTLLTPSLQAVHPEAGCKKFLSWFPLATLPTKLSVHDVVKVRNHSFG